MLNIDWQQLLLGDEEWSFLLEAAFRSVIMFLVILLTLRLLGKRGIKQLSVFELGVIIGLGSAAGDPMFYKDVGILAGMVAFGVVITLYKMVTYLINRSDGFERFVEGEPRYVVQKGCILIRNFEKEDIARDELFMQLRLKSVTHLGQVDSAIVETNGEVSVFYLPDEKVKPGLPIMPEAFGTQLSEIEEQGTYSCTHCGHTAVLHPMPEQSCPICKKQQWMPSWDNKRVR